MLFLKFVYPNYSIFYHNKILMFCLQTAIPIVNFDHIPWRKKRPEALKYVIRFVTTVKFSHGATIWKKLRGKSIWILWILNHDSRSITRSLFVLKAFRLGQMTNFTVAYHVLVSIYRLVKIRSSLTAQLRNGRFTPTVLI